MTHPDLDCSWWGFHSLQSPLLPLKLFCFLFHYICKSFWPYIYSRPAAQFPTFTWLSISLSFSKLNFASTFSCRSTMIFSFQRNPPWSTQIKTVGIFNSATFCSACLDFSYYDHSRWWYFSHQSTNLLMFLYLGFKTGKNELTLR